MQNHPFLTMALGIGVKVLDSGSIEGARTSDYTVHFIIFFQQEFCQVRAVLGSNDSHFHSIGFQKYSIE